MLNGLFVPLFTAFNSDQSVAYEETVAHASWLIKSGVDGLVPFGTFGEGASLSLAERIKLTDGILGEAHGAKIIPSVISNSFGEIKEYIEFANSKKIDGLMVMPPGYFRPSSESALISFFERVIEISKHPIIAYNFPAMSLTLPPTVVSATKVWGVKDSSGQLPSAQGYLDSGTKVLMGSDSLLAEGMRIGASGGICGMANFFPERMKRVYDLASNNEFDSANELLKPVVEFSNLYVKSDYTPALAISALKSAAVGVIPTRLGDMRTPVPRIDHAAEVLAAGRRIIESAK